ncbi:monooxygenase [Plenodomus tracheiphilus IPT5]|uniref:Monooxygenase n=1 Tax=Plenodomus tracheiphilus IPT5 TaxID=1408161 RepID=A0A6A7B614_9PLEO|nr:monooxygenase [Plenodomus tracheiphilus IPT5]
MSAPPKIAIIGAGPVSLTLANNLQYHSIPFTVFEASTELRSQGGSLDLHPHTGQLALKEAGLWKEFTEHARPESDAMKVVTMDGEVLWDENGADKQEVKEEHKFDGRPEIDRTKLLHLLFNNLRAGQILFGKKLNAVTEQKETGFDLVVGGDGAWSKARNLLSDTKPSYSGITMVVFWCDDIYRNPWLVNYVGEGSIMAFGEGCAVQSQRQGNGGLQTYGSLRVPEDFLTTCGIDWTDNDTAGKQYVEEYFSHISPDLRRVMLESRDGLTLRPLYELPVGYRWTRRPGVTLIGDAAHVFTPFAGEGVNTGMKDALVLAQEIARAGRGEKTLNEGVADYEDEMFPRAAKAAAKTLRGKINHFDANGAKELADRFKEHYYRPQQE